MSDSTYNKMDPEVKAKWLEALRSGEYEQGSNVLFRDGCHCCLGVLAEINNVPRETKGSFNETYYNFNGYESVVGVPGDYCGIDPVISYQLMDMNDGYTHDEYGNPRKYSFVEIADFIEKNL